MNKKLPLISLFIMSIVSIFYWTLKPKEELYEAKWNAPDATLAITIDGEISTTFPTTNLYTGTVECTSGTGKVEWNESKWILTTSGITKGSTKCNAIFTKIPSPNGWIESEKGTLLEALRSNNQLKATLTSPGKEISLEDEALLASTEDDYGTSYYFRGAVINNYVEFANKCWRIVRVTGDGSIKLVLHNDNTGDVSNPCSSVNNGDTAAYARRLSGINVYQVYFSSNNDWKDNSYVGFISGAAGASDYASTHANTIKAMILNYLETWYKNFLASYESKLADTIWCNDKSTFTTLSSGSTYGTGLGYGTNQTGYGAYNRIMAGTSLDDVTSYASPSLICPNDNNGGKLSKFTVDDTANGNGDLTYKVGLLTVDELAFAGLKYSTTNKTTYLYENTNYSWWTLSPSVYKEEIDTSISSYKGAWIFTCTSTGMLIDQATNKKLPVRPSIALVSSTTISGGSGTSEDPYIVN